MPIPTPFHARTAPLCQSHQWRDWSGYLAPIRYELTPEREYWAIRDSAGLLDVSPLFKYEIRGADAERLLNRVTTRDFSKCRPGQVMYAPWCDEEGKLIHDGNVVRLEEQRFRVTTADPMLRWFEDCAVGLDVRITDVSQDLAALALQGPKSRAILQQVVTDIDLGALAYFRAAQGVFNGAPLLVTRTGFTGDLGYELWIAPPHAEFLWDRLLEVGRAYNILPVGLDALDMVRVEAGLLLIGVDYISAPHALLDAQKSSPFDAGLGWAVKLNKPNFVGKRALLAEQTSGVRWSLVGLTVDWFELERLWGAVGLRPSVVGKVTSRASVPVYKEGEQVGQATSHLFSPVLKKFIGLASVETAYAHPGTHLELELTVEYRRVMAQATVTKLPFFNPERKRA